MVETETSSAPRPVSGKKKKKSKSHSSSAAAAAAAAAAGGAGAASGDKAGSNFDMASITAELKSTDGITEADVEEYLEVSAAEPLSEFTAEHIAQLNELYSAPEQALELLCKWFAVVDYHENPRPSTAMDYHLGNHRFTLNAGLTVSQAVTVLNLLKSLFDPLLVSPDSATLDSAWDSFSTAVTAFALSSPPTLSMEDVRSLTAYIKGSFFQHWKLYKAAFAQDQPIFKSSLTAWIETPMPIDPLASAMTEEQAREAAEAERAAAEAAAAAAAAEEEAARLAAEEAAQKEAEAAHKANMEARMAAMEEAAVKEAMAAVRGFSSSGEEPNTARSGSSSGSMPLTPKEEDELVARVVAAAVDQMRAKLLEEVEARNAVLSTRLTKLEATATSAGSDGSSVPSSPSSRSVRRAGSFKKKRPKSS